MDRAVKFFIFLSVLLVGSGGHGCEFVRVMAMMGCCTDPEAKLSLMDDNRVTKFNRNAHFWFTPNSIGELKAKVAQQKAWELSNNMNIDIVTLRVGSVSAD